MYKSLATSWSPPPAATARPIVCEECARVIEEKVKPLIAVYPQGPTLAAGLMMAKQLQAAIREHGKGGK